jgi:hypothetical protein
MTDGRRAGRIVTLCRCVVDLSERLTPFRHALDELKQIAEATEGTIRHWKQQLDAAKKPFLESLTASTNAVTSTSRRRSRARRVGQARRPHDSSDVSRHRRKRPRSSSHPTSRSGQCLMPG